MFLVQSAVHTPSANTTVGLSLLKELLLDNSIRWQFDGCWGELQNALVFVALVATAY